MWFDNFDDDICWCGNSDTCENKECFRHLDNKKIKEGIYTLGLLKNTIYCPLNEKKGEE